MLLAKSELDQSRVKIVATVVLIFSARREWRGFLLRSIINFQDWMHRCIERISTLPLCGIRRTPSPSERRVGVRGWTLRFSSPLPLSEDPLPMNRQWSAAFMPLQRVCSKRRRSGMNAALRFKGSMRESFRGNLTLILSPSEGERKDPTASRDPNRCASDGGYGFLSPYRMRGVSP